MALQMVAPDVCGDILSRIMELLIDTWNVLHQTGILPPESAGIGRRGLIRLIGSSRWSRGRTTLVCDGTPSDPCPTGARIEIVFTGPHRTADEEIMQRVAASSARRSILVVTNDREIIRSIKAAGAQHLGSAVFLQILVDDHNFPHSKKTQKPTGLSEGDVLAWKERFGLDEDAIEELINSTESDLPPTNPPSQPQDRNKPRTDRTRATQHDDSALPPDLLEEARRLLDS